MVAPKSFAEPPRCLFGMGSLDRCTLVDGHHGSHQFAVRNAEIEAAHNGFEYDTGQPLQQEQRHCVAAKPGESLEELKRRANNENTDGIKAKPSNPKDAVGVRKARWFSIIPLRVLVGVGVAMLEGALKYGRHNYRIAGIRASVYVDAVVNGHLVPWMEGEDIDPDSGLSHIDKALASLMVLRDGMLEGNWVDDRPPIAQNFSDTMNAATKRVGELLDKYPEGVRKDAFTRADTVGADYTTNLPYDKTAKGVAMRDVQ